MNKSISLSIALALQLHAYRLAQEANKRGDSGVEKFYNLVARQKIRLARLTPLTLVESQKK
ncbi:MAG: hypothetical protein WA058_01895 [Minisyncoccia bacterium]